jgi:hypothetical protein
MTGNGDVHLGRGNLGPRRYRVRSPAPMAVTLSQMPKPSLLYNASVSGYGSNIIIAIVKRWLLL